MFENQSKEPDTSKFKKWKSQDIFRHGHLIGKGEHGNVYSITIGWFWYKEKFAVKLIDLSKVPEYPLLHVQHLSGISTKHESLVNVLCVWKDDGYVYIWMEPCTYNLLSLMEQLQRPDSSISSMFSHILCRGDPKMGTLIHYIKQLAQGLQDLHTEGIIHSNLKPENILLAGKSLKHMDYNTFKSKSPLYKSPEVINDNDYRFESDVYALGKIITDLLDIVDDCKKKRAVENLTKLMKSIKPEKRPIMAVVVEKMNSIEKMWF